jgi:hypothetical protein
VDVEEFDQSSVPPADPRGNGRPGSNYIKKGDILNGKQHFSASQLR